MPYVDVCIANEEDAKDVFGIQAANTDVEGRQTRPRTATSAWREQLTAQLRLQRPWPITLRTSISASDNRLERACSTTGGTSSSSPGNYPIHIVDRVGGGDSFGGALDSRAAQRTNAAQQLHRVRRGRLCA